MNRVRKIGRSREKEQHTGIGSRCIKRKYYFAACDTLQTLKLADGLTA